VKLDLDIVLQFAMDIYIKTLLEEGMVDTIVEQEAAMDDAIDLAEEFVIKFNQRFNKGNEDHGNK
jgi:hypothetical protein